MRTHGFISGEANCVGATTAIVSSVFFSAVVSAMGLGSAGLVSDVGDDVGFASSLGMLSTAVGDGVASVLALALAVSN